MTEEDYSIRINVEDTEGERRVKREVNLNQMQKWHKRGARNLPTGTPTGCKVDQPKDHILPEWGCKTADTQFSNGETRNLYFDGKEKKYYAYGFAGRARITRESVEV